MTEHYSTESDSVHRINDLLAVLKNIHAETCLGSLYFLECEFVSVGVDFYLVAVGELAG